MNDLLQELTRINIIWLTKIKAPVTCFGWGVDPQTVPSSGNQGPPFDTV